MAQIIDIENKIIQTVDFSTVDNGDFFVYANLTRVKLDNNNPNNVVIETGAVSKMNDTDQVILPNTALLKLE